MAVTQRAHRPVRRSWAPTVGPGMILGAVASVGVIVSMFLPWRTGSIHPSDVPASFLWDRTTTSQNPSLLIFLIPLALVLVIGTFVPMGAGVRLFGAIGTLVVVGLFAYQLDRALNTFGGSLGDALDTGFYFAAIGGVIGLVSGLMPSHAMRRRDEVVDDERYE